MTFDAHVQQFHTDRFMDAITKGADVVAHPDTFAFLRREAPRLVEEFERWCAVHKTRLIPNRWISTRDLYAVRKRDLGEFSFVAPSLNYHWLPYVGVMPPWSARVVIA